MRPRPLTLTANPAKSSKSRRGAARVPTSPLPLSHCRGGSYPSYQKAEKEGRIRGITLPGGRRQQSIIQYADDSAFMIRGEKTYIDKLVRLLQIFTEASGMEINWEKSSAYWFDKFTHKPEWLADYNWR